MKRYYYLTAVLMIAAAFGAVWQTGTRARTGERTVQLTLTADKPSYILGEVVGLNFELTNLTDEKVGLEMPGVYAGNLRLYVSADGAEFVEYRGPHWNTLETASQPVQLATGESLRTEASFLYNTCRPTAHLSPLYAERIRRERLDTEFAVVSEGRRWLKAVYQTDRQTIESEPVLIEVSEPRGLDGEIWNTLKRDGAFAYFLQTAELRYFPGSDEALGFTGELERIAAQYPGTYFGDQIARNLEKYRAMQENLRQLGLTR